MKQGRLPARGAAPFHFHVHSKIRRPPVEEARPAASQPLLAPAIPDDRVGRAYGGFGNLCPPDLTGSDQPMRAARAVLAREEGIFARGNRCDHRVHGPICGHRGAGGGRRKRRNGRNGLKRAYVGVFHPRLINRLDRLWPSAAGKAECCRASRKNLQPPSQQQHASLFIHPAILSGGRSRNTIDRRRRREGLLGQAGRAGRSGLCWRPCSRRPCSRRSGRR